MKTTCSNCFHDPDDSLLRAVFEQSPEAILVITMRGRIVMCNPSAVRLLGLPEEQLVGADIEAFVVSSHPFAANVTAISPWWSDIGRSPLEAEAVGRHGLLTPLEAAIAAVTIDRQAHFIVSMRDISERRRIEKILAERPLRDPESGLYGSQMLPLFLGEELDRALRHGHPMALVLIEIASCGEAAFSAVTRVVAEYVRLSDKALRIGDRCLALLLPETTGWEADSLSERLRRILAAALRSSEDAPATEVPELHRVHVGMASFPRNGDTMQQMLAVAQLSLEQDRSSRKEGAADE